MAENADIGIITRAENNVSSLGLANQDYRVSYQKFVSLVFHNSGEKLGVSKLTSILKSNRRIRSLVCTPHPLQMIRKGRRGVKHQRDFLRFSLGLLKYSKSCLTVVHSNLFIQLFVRISACKQTGRVVKCCCLLSTRSW